MKTKVIDTGHKMALYRCTVCIAGPLVRSRRRSLFDFLLMLVLLRPWRCPHCRARYVRPII